jgi:intracellular multiplication protein IcmL
MSSVNNKQEDAVVMVHLRNEFYKKKFYLTLAVYFLSIIVIAILVGVLVYLIKNPIRPLYFVTDSAGRLIQDVPRQVPNMSTEEVAKWAINAVETAYSYDYVNYRTQLQNAQKYFNDYGWRNYMDGLRSSNNLLALTQRKLVGMAKVVDKPKLQIEGLLGGAYAWKFEMPLLVTYLTPPYGVTDRFQNALKVTVVVQRQSILTSDDGLAVVQMIGRLLSTPTGENLSAPPPG